MASHFARNLDLDAGTGGVAIGDRVNLTGLGVDVLRNISGMGVAPLAQSVTLHADAVRVFAAWAVRGMSSEVLHYIALIIASGAADGVGGRNELDDTARHLGWCAGQA